MISMPGSELATADRRIPMEEIMEEKHLGLLSVIKFQILRNCFQCCIAKPFGIENTHKDKSDTASQGKPPCGKAKRVSQLCRTYRSASPDDRSRDASCDKRGPRASPRDAVPCGGSYGTGNIKATSNDGKDRGGDNQYM